jgi:hypothetical protein
MSPFFILAFHFFQAKALQAFVLEEALRQQALNGLRRNSWACLGDRCHDGVDASTVLNLVDRAKFAVINALVGLLTIDCGRCRGHCGHQC